MLPLKSQSDDPDVAIQVRQLPPPKRKQSSSLFYCLILKPDFTFLITQFPFFLPNIPILITLFPFYLRPNLILTYTNTHSILISSQLLIAYASPISPHLRDITLKNNTLVLFIILIYINIYIYIGVMSFVAVMSHQFCHS